MSYEIIRKLDSHPIPLDQDEIDEIWNQHNDPAMGEPPHVDEAHEEYVRTIAEYDEWHVFRTEYPFNCHAVVFWNRAFGQGFRVDDDEGAWHLMVNLFAEIVDQEGDCRDAEYSSSLMASGSYDQRCKNCGGSWTVG